MRLWSIRVTGLSVPIDDVNYLGQDLACMKNVYERLIVPVLKTTLRPSESNPEAQIGPEKAFLLDEIPSLHQMLENGHFLGKVTESKVKKGVMLPPTIIIRFKSRFFRNLFLRLKRFALPTPSAAESERGITFFTVSPDMTKVNHSVLTRLRLNKNIEAAWAWDGRIKFRLYGCKNVHTVNDVFSRIEDIINQARQPPNRDEFGGARPKQPPASTPSSREENRRRPSSSSASRSPRRRQGRSPGRARFDRQQDRGRSLHKQHNHQGVTTRYRAFQERTNYHLLPNAKDLQCNKFRPEFLSCE